MKRLQTFILTNQSRQQNNHPSTGYESSLGQTNQWTVEFKILQENHLPLAICYLVVTSPSLSEDLKETLSSWYYYVDSNSN